MGEREQVSEEVVLMWLGEFPGLAGGVVSRKVF